MQIETIVSIIGLSSKLPHFLILSSVTKESRQHVELSLKKIPEITLGITRFLTGLQYTYGNIPTFKEYFL